MKFLGLPLLVAEGDFSFAKCLARAFGNASNMVATSRDTELGLHTKHPTAAANLLLLKDKGCTVIHSVDACTMSNHHLLCHRKFDRIVFNFPHAGFPAKENQSWQISLHQDVVRGFLRNAYELVTEKGEVHVTHRTGYPYCQWEIAALGREAEALFDIEDHPGYENKSGDGDRSNDRFPVGECVTYIFAKN